MNKEENAKFRQKMRDLVIEAKQGPCKDCGGIFPHYVMEFDHLRDKHSTVGSMWGKYGSKKILEEISKCELLCANCHKIRTYNRR